MAQDYYQTICIECNEAVYNPLCPVCISNHLREWLKDKSAKIRNAVLKNVDNLIKINHDIIGKAVQCIVCGKKNTFLCPYCFTEAIYKELKQLKADKELMQEFLDFFNYDFEHVGYSKDFV